MGSGHVSQPYHRYTWRLSHGNSPHKDSPEFSDGRQQLKPCFKQRREFSALFCGTVRAQA